MQKVGHGHKKAEEIRIMAFNLLIFVQLVLLTRSLMPSVNPVKKYKRFGKLLDC